MSKNIYGSYSPQYQNYQPQHFGGIANNGYYYPVFPNQQYPQPQQPAQAQAASMQLYAVNGVEGAKAYALPPSSSAYLIDSDNPYLYYKESDAQGKCVIKAFTITETNLDEINKPSVPDTSNFATKSDLSELEQKIDGILQELQKVSKPTEVL